MTGYKGRLGIYEIMTMTNGLRELVRENVDIEDLRQQSYRDGMKPMRINGALKVASGAFFELLDQKQQFGRFLCLFDNLFQRPFLLLSQKLPFQASKQVALKSFHW